MDTVTLTGVRPEVLSFALLMESKLREHDDRPDWKDADPSDLAYRAFFQIQDLKVAIFEALTRANGEVDPDLRIVKTKAVNAANFAMMVLDVCGALPITVAASGWRPIGTADKSIAVDMQLTPDTPRMLHSFPIWVRCEGGKPYEASWVQRKIDTDDGYWWDWDREDIVDPDEWMPHPLHVDIVDGKGAIPEVGAAN